MEGKEDVGFLESDVKRKSNSRLTVAISAGICVLAAIVEGVGEVVTSIKCTEINQANWQEVAYLVATLLLGNGALKAAQAIKRKTDKT